MGSHRPVGSDLDEGYAFRGGDISPAPMSKEPDALGFVLAAPMVLTGFMLKEAGSGVRPGQLWAPQGQYPSQSVRVQEMGAVLGVLGDEGDQGEAEPG